MVERKRSRPAGVGLGLRWEFIEAFVESLPALPLLEVSPENYIGRGGYYRALLGRAVDAYPILSHGLSLSLGGVDPLEPGFLQELRLFLDEVKSPWHSDHLCFGSFGGQVLHDLLPVPFHESEVQRIADRIKRAQDGIGRPMAIENVSYYMHPGKAEMGEAEFIARVCEAADCALMLDVNNAYVNSVNFGFDIDAWMRTVPLERVVQMHIAGHEWYDEGTWAFSADQRGIPSEGRLIVDTHGAPVTDPVLALFERVVARTGPVAVVLERDQTIPELPELLAEVEKIQGLYDRGLRSHGERPLARELQVGGHP